MFGPSKHSPRKTFANDKDQTTSVNFTRNLHELRFRATGNGRDSYIYSNNGGFSIANKVTENLNKSGRFLPTLKERSLSPKQASAVDTQRPRYYNQDGSGRDGYIAQNNGGFTQSNFASVALDPRIKFKNSLRGYEPDGDYLKRRNYNKYGIRVGGSSPGVNLASADRNRSP